MIDILICLNPVGVAPETLGSQSFFKHEAAKFQGAKVGEIERKN